VVRLRKYLVIAQVACSVTLLIDAVALSRSAQRLPARWIAAIFAVVGAAAFLLSLLGLPGVLAFLTRQRMREFGVHIAVGARQSAIMLLLGRQSVMPIVTGLAFGSAGAVAINQLFREML
jgi:ABC-type antimicrobial peptide transport system permease subunit